MKHKRLKKKRFVDDSVNISTEDTNLVLEPIDTNESFFEIDLNELDKACAVHPKLYHEYAIQMPDARKDLEEAEAELKVIKAEVDRQIRDNPSKYNLKDNPTEASIANTIPIQPAYRKVQSKIIVFQHRVNMIDAMLKSIDRKGGMIDNAVRLHGQDYFSPIRISGKDATRINEMKKQKVRRKVDDN